MRSLANLISKFLRLSHFIIITDPAEFNDTPDTASVTLSFVETLTLLLLR